MSNIPITPGTGVSSVATETISGVDYQKIKVIDGTAASTNAWKINSDGTAQVSIMGTPSISGAVTVVGTPSISGAVTVVGTPSISGAVTIVGNPITYAPTASFVSGVTSMMTQTTVTSVLAAAAGGQRNYVTNILVTNQQTSVTGIGTQVNIIDDGSGQVMYAGFAAGQGGGFALTFPTPLRQPTSAFSLSAKAATQASVIVAASGYTAP